MPVSAGKPVIGLTGGIGSGKSLVASQLATLGCALIDADKLAAQVLEDPQVQREVFERWGEAVRGPNGRIDRQALARIVFDNPDELARLEGLIHPMVHESRVALHRRYQRDPQVRAIVEDCPLLMEKGFDADCDVVIFVTADSATRRRRLAATRHWTGQELQRREENQLPLDIKAERADHTIVNSAGKDDCLSHVRSVFSKVLKQLNG